MLLQGAEDDVSFVGLDSAWIPQDREISPYVGVGLGVVGTEGDSVLGTKIEAGMEFFRLHGVRLLAGVNALVPFGGDGDIIKPGVHLRLCF